MLLLLLLLLLLLVVIVGVAWLAGAELSRNQNLSKT